jgi:hypothetical protein
MGVGSNSKVCIDATTTCLPAGRYKKRNKEVLIINSNFFLELRIITAIFVLAAILT